MAIMVKRKGIRKKAGSTWGARRASSKFYVYSTGKFERSEAEKALRLPSREIKRGALMTKGFRIDQLIEIRKRNGVGRPPKVNLEHLVWKDLMKNRVPWGAQVAQEINAKLAQIIGVRL